jgi:hypothetical protein
MIARTDLRARFTMSTSLEVIFAPKFAYPNTGAPVQIPLTSTSENAFLPCCVGHNGNTAADSSPNFHVLPHHVCSPRVSATLRATGEQ